MEGLRITSKAFIPAALIGVVFALPVIGLTCERSSPSERTSSSLQLMRVAGEGKQPENRAKDSRDKCKRAPGARTPAPKGCPDGGERLPQDNKRSPLDDAPPLTPLVA
jgi:hypothetical protein